MLSIFTHQMWGPFKDEAIKEMFMSAVGNNKNNMKQVLGKMSSGTF